MFYLLDDLIAVSPLVTSEAFGLILDIDGTISPIAPSPDLARVTSACKRYLRTLSRHLPLVAVVSGRPAKDARRLVGISSLIYVGNHGLDRWENGKVTIDPAALAYRSLLKEALKRLRAVLVDPGVLIEDKGVTASIHYRLAADAEEERSRILSEVKAIAEPKGFRLAEGRMVVEIRPPVEANKGAAVMRLVKDYSLEAALYVGDDRTDVDAFVALRRWRKQEHEKALTVAVWNRESGNRLLREADAYLNGVADVERFLAWLSDECRGNSV